MTRTPGPTAFVDEAYIQHDGHPGIYLLAAVLVEPDELDASADAARVAARGGPFHATALHHRGHARPLEDMLDVVSEYASWSIVVAHTPISQTNEMARQLAMQRLLKELHSNKVTDVILDVRGNQREWDHASARGLPMPAINYRDRDTYRTMAAGRQISHRMRLIHRDDRTEPGLWLADAVAWSARRALAADEPQWFNRVVDATTVYEAATGQLLVLNSDGAAPPNGDRGPHGQARFGVNADASPVSSTPRYPPGPGGDQYPRMGELMASVLDQASRARTPTVVVSTDLAVQLLGQARQIAADIADIRSALQDSTADAQRGRHAATERELAPADGAADDALPVDEGPHADLD